MTELELALKNHDWSLAGFAGRVLVDQLMRQHPAEASALWEKHCPWSNSNGGYIIWSKQ
jgi:hypothetical protein